MDRDYWQDYWDNYYKFMAVYLREFQNAYPDADIKSEYLEVASLFEPSMPLKDDERDNEYVDVGDNNNLEGDNNQSFTSPSGGQSGGQFTSPGVGQSGSQFTQPGVGQSGGQFIQPGIGQPDAPFILPGGGQFGGPFTPPGGVQSPAPFISPEGGQFTINNCRRMAIVRVVMRRGFNPMDFYLVVDKADRRSIQGFRIACEGNRIRFVPMAIEYRNINFIECAF